MNEESPGGKLRIGDAEREDAVKRLGAHYEAGRLTADEHNERVGQALEAKTAADLNALFDDLPEGQPPFGAAPGAPGGGDQAWNGPWGWTKPPWTAAETGGAASGPRGGAGGSGRRGPDGRGAQGRPSWAAKGPLGRIPLPVLIALAVVGVLASIACVVGGGHPPVLPLLLIVAGVVIYKKRQQERRA